jgi:tRNA-uridine 2-sulfurtransferase
MDKVCVAMSGGVDSSVAAALLKRRGFDVCGITMKLVDKSLPDAASPRSCCGFDAGRDAKLVADAIGIPHYTMNAVDVFRKTVIADFATEYRRGRTPNPCVRCNRFVKFDFLMKKADELGCRFLATGHYAVIRDGALCRGRDANKDQSYFLYPVYEADVCRVLFPVGEKTKGEVRAIAADLGLVTARKRESQDICFVEDGDYAGLLDNDTAGKVGPIIDTEGKVLGRHDGIHRYTIGQRKGLGALGRKMFVKEIRVPENTVVVGTEAELYATTVIATDAIVAPGFRFDGSEYGVQVRYRTPPVAASVSLNDSKTLRITLREPVRAVAPGQSIVVYKGDMVAAGGVIERTG